MMEEQLYRMGVGLKKQEGILYYVTIRESIWILASIRKEKTEHRREKRNPDP